MNLGKYINDLLQENDTVIIPGIGAIISRYKPAQTDYNSGIIFPPSKSITFDPEFKTNDGLLTGRIAAAEHISYRKAQIKVEKLCDDLLYRLDTGERITIENIGVLFHDPEGIINFEPAQSQIFLQDAFGLEPVTLKDMEDQNTDLQTAAIHIEETEPAVKSKSDSSDEKDITVKVIDETPPPFEKNKKEETELRGTGLYRFIFWSLIIIIPLLLITAGIYLLRKPKAKKSFPVEIKVEPSPVQDSAVNAAGTVILPDSAKTDSAITEITDTLKAISDNENEYYLTPERSKFYLIGGSFKEKENAEKYYQQMKGRGYEPFHLKDAGNFHIVGLGIYDSEREAYIAQINFIDKYPDSGAWVLMPE